MNIKVFLNWKEKDEELLRITENIQQDKRNEILETYKNFLVTNNLFYILLKVLKTKAGYYTLLIDKLFNKEKLSTFMFNKQLESKLVDKGFVILKNKEWENYLNEYIPLNYKKSLDNFLFVNEIKKNCGIVLLKHPLWKIKLLDTKIKMSFVNNNKRDDMFLWIEIWIMNNKDKKDKREKAIELLEKLNKFTF